MDEYLEYTTFYHPAIQLWNGGIADLIMIGVENTYKYHLFPPETTFLGNVIVKMVMYGAGCDEVTG
jgi:hypothetical protein